MRQPRGLSAEETALWRKVASSVRPLKPSIHLPVPEREGESAAPPATTLTNETAVTGRALPHFVASPAKQPASRTPVGQGLDAGWDRKLARGMIDPDFTLDLHGATLDAAYARLGMGLNQARTMGARVVLLITGRPRPVEAADRGRMRGAIRAKVGDWIAAGEHGTAIAAIRPAHRRHGGPGALYLVLRRRRG